MSRRDSLCASAVAIQETELASSTAPADLVVDMDQQQDAVRAVSRSSSLTPAALCAGVRARSVGPALKAAMLKSPS